MKKLSTIKIVGIIVGLAFLIFGVQTCNTYNSSVTMGENVDRNWADVQNQYQRRSDLIGNLVAVVKQYSIHEKSTLTEVIEARAKASSIVVNAKDISASQLQDINNSQLGLTQSLGKLMMVVERYPELKAQENFLKFQSEIVGTENRISVSRENFNNAVQVFNTYVRAFPNNIIMSMFPKFKPRDMFKANDDYQNAPIVNF